MRPRLNTASWLAVSMSRSILLLAANVLLLASFTAFCDGAHHRRSSLGIGGAVLMMLGLLFRLPECRVQTRKAIARLASEV